MSKFQSTISTVAALASICGATAAGWKLAQVNTDQSTTHLNQKIEILEKKLEDAMVKPEVQQVQLKIHPEVKQTEMILSVEPPPPVGEVAQDALTAP